MRRDTRQALRSRVVFVNAPLERSESDSSARIGVSILKLVLVPFRYFSIDIYRNIDIFDNTSSKHTVGTESIQTPLHFSLFVILQPFAKII